MGLLQEFKSKDHTHFNDFYEETKKAVFYSIYVIVRSPEISEDIMQETYIALLEHTPSVREDSEILPWLIKTAKNKAINYYQRNKLNQQYMALLQNYSYSNDRYIDTGLLKKIKGALSDEEFDIFVMHVLGEYTFKEISTIKNIPIGTATWSYQESRKKLQSLLGGNDSEKRKRHEDDDYGLN